MMTFFFFFNKCRNNFFRILRNFTTDADPYQLINFLLYIIYTSSIWWEHIWGVIAKQNLFLCQTLYENEFSNSKPICRLWKSPRNTAYNVFGVYEDIFAFSRYYLRYWYTDSVNIVVCLSICYGNKLSMKCIDICLYKFWRIDTRTWVESI